MKLLARSWRPLAFVVGALLFFCGGILISLQMSEAQIWRWSQTAGSNGTIDPNINWATGMSPSAVSPSARQMMAAVAQVRDDWSGANATGGTASAYTLSSNQHFDTLAHLNGQKLCFVPNNTNSAGATLSVDSLTAEPINTAPSTAVGAGILVQGTPYCVVYKNADLAFYLLNFTGNPYNIPLGGILFSSVNIAPNSNFAFANGQAISRTTYAAYFALVSTTYGSGNGVSTFNVPDLMSRVVLGLDQMGGASPSGRITFTGQVSVLGGSFGQQGVTIAQNQLPNVSPTFSGTTQAWNTNLNFGSITNNASAGAGGPYWGPNGSPATVSVTPSGTISSINGGVSQQQTLTVQPSIALPIFVRIF